MAFKDTVEKKEIEQQLLNEPTPDFEKASTDLLRHALLRSHTDRFLMTTRLYKIALMLKKAKVTHQPFIPKD